MEDAPETVNTAGDYLIGIGEETNPADIITAPTITPSHGNQNFFERKLRIAALKSITLY